MQTREHFQINAFAGVTLANMRLYLEIDVCVCFFLPSSRLFTTLQLLLCGLMAESRSAIRSRNFFSVAVSALSSDICLAFVAYSSFSCLLLHSLAFVGSPTAHGSGHSQRVIRLPVSEAGRGWSVGGGGGVRGDGRSQ